MAVDSGGHAAEFSNGAWKLEPVMADIEAVSCPAAGSCLAVAQSGAAESYTGGHWARAPAASSRRHHQQPELLVADHVRGHG